MVCYLSRPDMNGQLVRKYVVAGEYLISFAGIEKKTKSWNTNIYSQNFVENFYYNKISHLTVKRNLLFI